ncbi:MAG: hypothetical protein WC285_06480 [Candidatus Gracilibacteria bacterium]|jgi:hypothetical protein
MKELINRFKAETPHFWVKVRTIAIMVLGSCTAIWLANSTMDLQLDPHILTICKYAIAVSAATGLNAQLTKTDNNEKV